MNLTGELRNKQMICCKDVMGKNNSHLITELYKINRERHRFLGNEAENQQGFVAFAAPSSSQIWQIY